MTILLKPFFFFLSFIVTVRLQTSPISQHGYSSSSDFDWMSLLSEPVHKSLLDSPENSHIDLHYPHDLNLNKDSHNKSTSTKPTQFSKKDETKLRRRKRRSEKQKEKYENMSKEEKEEFRRYKREGTRKYRKNLKESIGFANRIDAERNKLLKLIKQEKATDSQKKREVQSQSPEQKGYHSPSSSSSTEFDWKSLLSSPIRKAIEEEEISSPEKQKNGKPKENVSQFKEQYQRRLIRLQSKSLKDREKEKQKNKQGQIRYRQKMKKEYGYTSKRQYDYVRLKELVKKGQANQKEKEKFEFFENEKKRYSLAKSKKREMKRMGLS